MSAAASVGSAGETIGGDRSTSTAVAMVILYSITGLITALFLGIIITGAVRAHRNPERYGPRNVAGQPRQSRAKGLARAMLETIPIVKFGDDNDRDRQIAAAKRDIEMATADDMTDTRRSSVLEVNAPVRGNESGDQPHAEATTGATTSTPATAESAAAAEPSTQADREHHNVEVGNNVCPICTDDFVRGQDVRVLPCQHQFHPDCIDPWLVNVSGTCPLCRINLNPEGDGQSSDSQSPGDQATGQANSATEQQQQQQQQQQSQSGEDLAAVHNFGMGRHSRFSAVPPLDILRARNTTVEERIAVLRRLRQHRDRSNEPNESAEEHQRRHSRLSARLRERFRVRTRRHGGPDHDEHPPPDENQNNDGADGNTPSSERRQ